MRKIKKIMFYSIILVLFYLGINNSNIIGIVANRSGQLAIAVEHPLFCSQIIYIYIQIMICLIKRYTSASEAE